MDIIGTPPDANGISDRMAISDVLYSHCRGLDRLELPLLQACYWPEAEVDYGSYRGPAQAFVELVIPALENGYELTRHGLSNTLIELRGQQAAVESLVNAAHLLPGASQEMRFSGRYLDKLEKRNGCWKLLHRQVVIDWARREPIADERPSEAFAQMARGDHRQADPLHNFLLQDSRDSL